MEATARGGGYYPRIYPFEGFFCRPLKRARRAAFGKLAVYRKYPSPAVKSESVAVVAIGQGARTLEALCGLT